MVSKTVKSAAGDPIEIVPDEDWTAATGAPLVSLRQWQGVANTKPLVLRALWDHGEFTDPKTGRVAKKVLDYMQEHYPRETWAGQSNILAVFRNPVNTPCIAAKVNGKRTFSMKLVALPETYYNKLMADIVRDGYTRKPAPQPVEPIPEPSQGDREAAALMEQVIMPSGMVAEAKASIALDGETQYIPGSEWSDADWEALQLDAPTVYEAPPPLELHIANQVAMSLLTACVEIVSSGSADTTQLSSGKRLADELQHAQHLLSQRLLENDKLRRQLREAADSIIALRHERDGLRSRLRATETNLAEVLKGGTAQAVNSEIHKRIDQFMRAAPTAKGD